METKEKEIWRDIPGYENCYQVSDRGRVRSLNRTVVCKNGQERFLKGRILDGNVHKTTGYRQFTLTVNGEGRTFTASQLAAVAFLNHSVNGHTKVVDHKNGDRLDDRVENLRIVTHRENTSTTCFRKDRDSLSSKFTGITWHKPNNKWRAKIVFKDKNTYLGLFNTDVEAYQAYQTALNKVKDNTFNPDEYKPVYTSRYTGVGFHKKSNKWISRVRVNGKQIHLGYFNDELKASEAYQKALSEINNGVFNPDEYKPKWSSSHKGVTFDKKNNKWQSQIWINGKNKYLGTFNTELEAFNCVQNFKQKNEINHLKSK